jgi:hypothetical protein
MNQLIKAMIDKNILSSEIKITANYTTKDSVGRIISKRDEFRLVTVQEQGNNYRFKLKQLRGNTTVFVWANDIIALDGMTPERYVGVYNINPDGTVKNLGKKRGRKPKSLLKTVA